MKPLTEKNRVVLGGLVDVADGPFGGPVDPSEVVLELHFGYSQRGYEFTASRDAIRKQLNRLVENGYALRRKNGYVPRAAGRRAVA